MPRTARAAARGIVYHVLNRGNGRKGIFRKPGAGCGKEIAEKLLDAWPMDRPASWLALVNRPLPAAESEPIKASLSRGRPLGDEKWTKQTAARLG